MPVSVKAVPPSAPDATREPDSPVTVGTAYDATAPALTARRPLMVTLNTSPPPTPGAVVSTSTDVLERSMSTPAGYVMVAPGCVGCGPVYVTTAPSSAGPKPETASSAVW